MNQKNISNTYALKGGTQGWKSAGYPMEGTASVPNPPGAPPQNAAPPNY